ncbi:MAG: pentapeptide repeat-containing protein [Nanoarchaeota archaeon]|nr:pentapeptide repeat-containing protein [Nanoarchaeota archaeon]
MADLKKIIKEGFEEERLEMNFLIKELKIIHELESAIASGRITEVKQSIPKLMQLTIAVHYIHQNLLSHLSILKEILPESKVEEINNLEKESTGFFNNIESILNPRSELFIFSIKGKREEVPSLGPYVDKLKQEITSLLEIIKQVETEFKYGKTVYKKRLSSLKLVDLLKGKGKYQNFTQKQRATLWNRWIRISVLRRVIKNADLSKTDLSGFNLSRFTFDLKVKLNGANLTVANLAKADLEEADLEEANLSGAILYKVELMEANLSGANLSGANLTKADLRKADLRKADFSRANLSGANLREANFSGANLRETDLREADLREANLNGADFSRANFTAADLSGANLTAANLTAADLSRARYDFNIKETLRKKGAIVD